MKYVWCVVGVLATIIWIHGIWTNSLDVVNKSLLTGFLVLGILEFIVNRMEEKS